MLNAFVLLVVLCGAGKDAGADVDPELEAAKPHPARGPGTLDALDKKDGFRDMKFGAKRIDFGDTLKTTKEDGDVVSYTKKNEDFRIGGAKLDFIFYDFYREQFFMVGAQCTGIDNFRKLKLALEEAYGRPHQDNEFIEDYSWRGAKARVWLKFDEARGVCMLAISSVQIAENKRDDEKKAAKDANL
jgi:hypothetical protein